MKMKPIVILCVAWCGFSVHLLLAATAAAEAPVVRQVPLAGTDDAFPCTVYPPKVTPLEKAGLIVHLYGAGGSHRHDGDGKGAEYNVGRPPFDTFRKLVAERGYWLVVPELGKRHWMNDAAVARVDAVIEEWIQQERVDPQRIHLLGSSMGGGSSLIYVMRRPEKVKSVVAVFPMTDFARWLEERPTYRASVEDAHRINDSNRETTLRAISALHNVDAFRRTPVFLLHGAKDPIVSVEHSRTFEAALRKQGYPVRYREVADEIHRDEIAGSHQEELADFLTKPGATPGTTSD